MLAVSSDRHPAADHRAPYDHLKGFLPYEPVLRAAAIISSTTAAMMAYENRDNYWHPWTAPGNSIDVSNVPGWQSRDTDNADVDPRDLGTATWPGSPPMAPATA